MIRYMPVLESMLWSRKTQRFFDDIEEMRLFVADHMNRFYRFIGMKEIFYNPCDVELKHIADLDPVMQWRNYRSVILDGRVVGYCGE